MNHSIIRAAAVAFAAAAMLFCTACDTIDDAAAAAAEKLPGLIEAGEEALGRLQEKGQELPEKIKEAAPDLIAQIEEATGLDFEAIAEKGGEFSALAKDILTDPEGYGELYGMFFDNDPVTWEGTRQDLTSKRATMEIVPLDDGNYHVDIFWGSSAFETEIWSFTGVPGESVFGGGFLEYTDCVRKTVATDDAGNITETVHYTDGAGELFATSPVNTILWFDYVDLAGLDAKFVFPDSIANLEGTWEDIDDGKIVLSLQPVDQQTMECVIFRAGTLENAEQWEFTAAFDSSDMSLSYENARYIRLTSDGSEITEETVSEDGTGRIYLDNGCLVWEDEKNPDLHGFRFAFVPEFDQDIERLQGVWYLNGDPGAGTLEIKENGDFLMNNPDGSAAVDGYIYYDRDRLLDGSLVYWLHFDTLDDSFSEIIRDDPDSEIKEIVFGDGTGPCYIKAES